MSSDASSSKMDYSRAEVQLAKQTQQAAERASNMADEAKAHARGPGRPAGSKNHK
jgi:hypothetical protein